MQNVNWRNVLLFIGILVVLAAGAVAAWVFLSHPSSSGTGNSVGNFFGLANNTTSVGPGSLSTNNTNQAQTIPVGNPGTQQKIFKIADGPVAGATFIETSNPTTTIARYAMADTGHVLDEPVSVANAVPQAVSNTTIPGIEQAFWLEGGNATILRYLDSSTIKTVYAGFPATSSPSLAVHIQFLPDGIVSIAGSPDGKSMVYLLKSPTGVDGYIAASNGSGSKKLFSLPLSQVQVQWPSSSALLVETNPAEGTPGIAFSVNTKTGAVSQLVYAQGLTATANSTFSKLLYETSSAVSSAYIHDAASGTDAPVLFTVIPEKCAWSGASINTVFCATPSATVSPGYIDAWHQGLASVADTILSLNTQSAKSTVITTPGGKDGGVASDIAQMAVSPDNQYLLFITKGDRSLWGVSLTQ